MDKWSIIGLSTVFFAFLTWEMGRYTTRICDKLGDLNMSLYDIQSTLNQIKNTSVDKITSQLDEIESAIKNLEQ